MSQYRKGITNVSITVFLFGKEQVALVRGNEFPFGADRRRSELRFPPKTRESSKPHLKVREQVSRMINQDKVTRHSKRGREQKRIEQNRTEDKRKRGEEEEKEEKQK